MIASFGFIHQTPPVDHCAADAEVVAHESEDRVAAAPKLAADGVLDSSTRRRPRRRGAGPVRR